MKSIERAHHGVDHRARASWATSLAVGLAMIVIGVAGLGASLLTGLVSVVVIGAALLAGGLFQVAQAVASKAEHDSRLPWMLGGLLAAGVGVFILTRQMMSLREVTVALTGLFLADAAFMMGSALLVRGPRWGWQVLSGGTNAVLGAMLLTYWPAANLWFLGAYLALALISRGGVIMAEGWQFRRSLQSEAGSSSPTPAVSRTRRSVLRRS